MEAVELCAGAGGEALGLERAGIGHACLLELDRDACRTLRTNRPGWDVREGDLRLFDATSLRGVALVSGGLPCPPYSVAGRQLGPADDRDLFGHGLRIIDEIRPEAAMLENVKGILDPRFEEVRHNIRENLRRLGYVVDWRLLNASDFGVPQLRPRVIFVALKARVAQHFSWPIPNPWGAPTVGETLIDLILSHLDTTELKQGQYLLRSTPAENRPLQFARGISARIRAAVLDRNGFTCQMCGLTPGEVDPSTKRKVRLHVGHIKDKSHGGKDEMSNLRTLCSTCNQGAKNVTGEKPSTIWLLTQIRRAGIDEQKAVFEWLQKKLMPK